HAERVSGTTCRARLVFDLLGEEPLGDRGDRPRLREVLDEARLPNPRHAMWLRRARHGSEEHRADQPHDGPLVHRHAGQWRARCPGATRDAQRHRVRRRLRRARGRGLRRQRRHVAALAAAAQLKTITLPPDHPYGDLKPGPGVEVTQRACRACHSTDYIVMQPRGDARQWEAVLTKMIKVFGASISDEDAKAIVGYLSTVYGK